MNEDLPITDMLIQYLDGELEGEQLTVLQQRIGNEPELAAVLEKLRLTQASVKSYGLKNNISTVHDEMMKELRAQSHTPVVGMKKVIRYGFRAAAIIVLLIGSGVLFTYLNTTSQQLFADKYQSYAVNEMRSQADSNRLVQAYRSGNMQQVQADFQTLSSPNATDYFLYGNAVLQLHQPAAAITAFQSVIRVNEQNHSHYFEDDLTYFLALAYLDNNQPRLALSLFEEIDKDTNHPYHRKINSWFMARLKRLSR